MDLNPDQVDKKDHIFMDFFSMYGKNFIEQPDKSRLKQGKAKTGRQPKEQAHGTPFNQMY